MDWEYEFRVRRQTAHPAHIPVGVSFPFKIQIVTRHIAGRLIVPVFAAFEESDDFCCIVEPLVIVQIQEPFPASCF